MTEFVSDILNYLQNNENAQGVVVALAAFGVPLFSFLLYLLFRILRIKVGAMASRALAALVTGYTFFGFITQIILLFSGVPALKMALIWLAMIIVYGIFVLFNRRMLYKILSTFNETKNSGQESLESYYIAVLFLCFPSNFHMHLFCLRSGYGPDHDHNTTYSP